jgi:hypothetical protein
MEEDTRKHLRGVRIIVTLSLLAACLSFAFSYVLFKDVSVPLERMRSQEVSALQSKVDSMIATRMNGRMDVELQMAIHNMKELNKHASPAVKAQAAKAIQETRTLLNLLRGQ